MNQKPNVIADFFIHNKLTQNKKMNENYYFSQPPCYPIVSF